MSEPAPVSESQFYMWRTLFALAHADNVVTKEEMTFMVQALEGIPFSPEQREVLTDDISNAQDIIEMFKQISEPKHQAEFFKFARELVWIDGFYDKEEMDIMLKLHEIHVRSVNIDDLVGNMDLEFETDERAPAIRRGRQPDPPKESNIKRAFFAFRDQFVKGRFN